MADSIKFTKEEMGEISNLQQSYSNVQNNLGQLNISRIRLEQQLNDLDNAEKNIKTQFTETQTVEKNFIEKINKKYGDGNLNLDNGVFTPKPIEETTDKTL